MAPTYYSPPPPPPPSCPPPPPPPPCTPPTPSTYPPKPPKAPTPHHLPPPEAPPPQHVVPPYPHKPLPPAPAPALPPYYPKPPHTPTVYPPYSYISPPPPPPPTTPYLASPPDSFNMTPPSPGGNHHTTAIAVGVSLGGAFFLAFLALGLFCLAKRKKKIPVPPPCVEEHQEIHETVTTGPYGEQTVSISVEDDMRVGGMHPVASPPTGYGSSPAHPYAPEPIPPPSYGAPGRGRGGYQG